MQFFHDISIDTIKDSVVILDIDGTLTCSSSTSVSDAVRQKISVLQRSNAVYLFSNNYNGVRSRMIARDLNVPYIESPHKKPNKKILNYITQGTCPVIAIGDKFLTDGLFAHFSRVEHIRVRRYHCATDSIWDRAACVFDDCIYSIAQRLGLTK
jgi:predicted HAD superfamily phosphohydrolase YqeG